MWILPKAQGYPLQGQPFTLDGTQTLGTVFPMQTSSPGNNIFSLAVYTPVNTSCRPLVTSSSLHCLGAQIPQRTGNN